MVLLVITDRLCHVLQKLREVKGGLPDELTARRATDAAPNQEPYLDDVTPGHPISHNQIQILHRLLKEEEPESAPSLNDLLLGTSVYTPPPVWASLKTPEYLALMKHLREEQEEREYRKMVASPSFPSRFTSSTSMLFPDSTSAISSSPYFDADDSVSYKDINAQLALILNVLLSIIGCSVAIWLASYAWGTAARLTMSMAGAAVVALAEVGVYFGYLKKVDDARFKERKTVEKKQVIRRHSLGGRKALEVIMQETAATGSEVKIRTGDARRRHEGKGRKRQG